MIKVLHITNWYPNHRNPHEAVFVKEYFYACQQYVEQELWHVQVRNDGKLFNLKTGDYGTNEHYLIIDTRIRVWRMQEIITLFLLAILRIRMGKKWWSVVNFHIAYPLLRFTNAVIHLYGIKIIITEHWSAYRNNFFLPLQSKSARRIANVFNYDLPVIAVSKALMTDIEKFAGHELTKKYVVPNIVDPTIFYPKTNTSKNGITFLMVASWAPIKRPILVMTAFTKLLSEYPNAVLRIVGAGAQFSKMQEFVATKKLEESIVLLGPMTKEEIAKEMRDADCFLHASEYETFSVVCAEALQCGLPVIASNVGGIPEFVDDKNGVLVENTDQDWLRALQNFAGGGLQLNRNETSIRAKRFYPQVVGKQLAQIYEQYCSNTSQ